MNVNRLLAAALVFVVLANADARPRHRSHSKQPSKSNTTPSQSDLAIDYQLGDSYQVSLNIYDGDGQIVREMLHEATRKEGSSHEVWDGRDANGVAMPKGEYTWKLLATHGLHARYLTTLGTSPNNGWDQWPGNYGGIFAVCADTNAIYFGSFGQSTIFLVKQSLDGTRQWVVPGAYEAWQGPIALGLAGDDLLMLQPNGMIQRLDADTSDRVGRFSAAWDTDDGIPRNLHAVAPISMAPVALPTLSSKSQPMDMACRAGEVAVSYYGHDAVRIYNPATGLQTREIAIPGPLGVAYNAVGELLTISNGSVVAINSLSKAVRPVVADVPDAYRLAVDATTGDILVAEQGRNQQVKRYSSAGKLLAAYGEPGGRKQGLYDSASFSGITDIAADSTGGFVVAENDAPRHTARFDSSGHLLREWIGPQSYAPYAEIDQADPTLAWGDSGEGSLIQYSLDLRKQAWTVRATYSYGDIAGGLFAGRTDWHARRHDGITYLCRAQPFAVLRVDEAKRTLAPVAAILNAASTTTDVTLKPLLPTSTMLWTDNDGDGKIEAAEFTNLPDPVWNANIGAIIGDDMSLSVIDRAGLRKLAISSWLPTGVPMYSLPLSIPLTHAAVPSMQPESPAIDDANYIWALYNADAGQGRTSRGIARWDGSGTMTFTVGATLLSATPDRYLSRIVGTTHGCVAVSDPVNGSLDVWDQDGLWVGHFLEDPDFAAAPRPAYRLNPQFIGHSIYTDPKSGDVLLVGSGVNNNPIVRITGWDAWQRQSGTLRIR